MKVKVINAILPLVLGAGAVACFLRGHGDAGTALLAAIAAHLLPSPIPPRGEP